MSAPTLEYEHKALSPLAPVWGITDDDEEGTFTALVAVTGVEDTVEDVIVPGAVTASLAARLPKGIHSHDDKQWTALTLVAEEWMPGDPRLPDKTRDGKPWPREAGAVFVKGQFNLATPEGRKAYENVKFFKQQCEWSVGYVVTPGKSKRDRKGVRHIYELTLYEYSTVLVAANPLAMTLEVKSLSGQGASLQVQAPAGATPQDVVDAIVRAGHGRKAAGQRVSITMPPGAAEAAQRLFREAKAGTAPAQGHSHGQGGEPSTMVALMLPPEAAIEAAVDGGLPAEEMHITLAYLGEGVAPDRITAVEAAMMEVAAAAGPLTGTIGGLGVFPEGEDGVPVWAPVDVPGLEVLRQRVVDALQEAGVPAASTHGYTPHVTRAYLGPADPLPEPLAPLPVTFSALEVVVGGMRTPIPLGPPNNDDDVQEEPVGTDQQAGQDLETKQAARPDPGLSYEEVSDRIHAAMSRWLGQAEPGQQQPMVATAATYPDLAVVTAERHGALQAWQVPYTVAGGDVELGDPQQVDLRVSTLGAERGTAMAKALDGAVAAVKSLLAAGGVETKAGQVLSKVNSRKLLAAYTALGEVLRSAGVDVGQVVQQDVPEAEPMPQEAPIQPDSTAPSALPAGVKSGTGRETQALTMAELLDGMQVIAAVHALTS
ncbi:hypothetical protein GCM10017673_37790 [Streptosporangium violaceochromogenes]|nr:hypothetical protein GCM10017673_37790 [Streptosporangium violaceochromogenes]